MPESNRYNSVFISSTYYDLVEHRRAVWDLLERFDVDVRGMEAFGARPETPLETCLAEVDQSEVYVGFIGFLLGSVEEGSGKSFTQLEYERARDTGKHLLLYLADEDNAVFAYKDFEHKALRIEKLEAFKKTLRKRHTVDHFTSASDLAEKIERDFRGLLREGEPESGRLPQDEAQHTVSLFQEFLVLPEEYSGREGLVSFRFKGEAFAASRDICEAFGFRFGASIGVPVEITAPEIPSRRDFNTIFASQSRAAKLLELSRSSGDKELAAYVLPLFSESQVKSERASFFFRSGFSIISPLAEPGLLGMKPYTQEADGKVILEFSKLAPSPTK